MSPVNNKRNRVNREIDGDHYFLPFISVQAGNWFTEPSEHLI